MNVLNGIPSGKWGFPGGPEGKASACNAGDLGSIPGWGRSPGEGKGYPPGLENSTDYSPQSHKESDMTELDLTERLSLFMLITSQC